MSVAACHASRRLRSSLRLLYDFHTLQARHAAATAADANAASHVPLRCTWCAQSGGMQWRQQACARLAGLDGRAAAGRARPVGQFVTMPTRQRASCSAVRQLQPVYNTTIDLLLSASGMPPKNEDTILEF